MRLAAIVLCGGRSTRMGQDKAALPFPDESMLQRVLKRVVAGLPEGAPVVVVTAAGQVPAGLPAAVRVVVDRAPNEGPLRGLEAGLAAVQQQVDAVFLTSCDVPFLEPRVIALLQQELSGQRGVMVCDSERLHPFCAVYSVDIFTDVQQLLARGERRLRLLSELPGVSRIESRLLRAVDPELGSLRNINTPAEYAAALAKQGG